jgi:enoyl-CoA hydratase
MSTDKILREKQGAVGRITFNNPERRNAVSLEMWEAVDAALDDFAHDPAIRVVMLTGAGGRAFVSGADISKFESERNTEEEVARYNAQTAKVYERLESFAKPTIASIEGSCVGGGVALAVCCDLRYCGQSSFFAIPAAKLGLGYGFKSLRRLVNIVGPAMAKEILFTARRFSAEDARIMGLVNRVVADGEVEAYVLDTASTIAGNAPLTVHAVKFTIGEVMKDQDERNLQRTEDLVRACFVSEDYKEGRRAFLEKRPPRFTGS